MKNKVSCVGFELQYSPLKRDCVENLANALHLKTREYTFDVIQEVQPGNEILMLFSNKQGPTQQLRAKVKTCTLLEEDHYQIALTTNVSNNIVINNSDLICLPITKGISAPTAMSLHCPACNIKTTFN